MIRNRIIVWNLLLVVVSLVFDYLWLVNQTLAVISLVVFLGLVGILAFDLHQLKRFNLKLPKVSEKAYEAIDNYYHDTKAPEKEIKHLKKCLSQMDLSSYEECLNRKGKMKKKELKSFIDFVKKHYIRLRIKGDIILGGQLMFVYIIFIKGIQMLMKKTPFLEATVHVSVVIFFILAAFILLPVLFAIGHEKNLNIDEEKSNKSLIVIVAAILYMMFDQTVKNANPDQVFLYWFAYGQVVLLNNGVTSVLFAIMIILMQYSKKIIAD